MTTWNEEENGMGFGGLVPSLEEREREAMTNYVAAMATPADIAALEAEAYAAGRKDEHKALMAELSSLLPGTYYMDPPDGGGVTVMEQLRRMADDAAKWRAHQHRAALAIECEIRCEG